jgi:hypothetical protein
MAIATRRTTAGDLCEMRAHLPIALFVSDGEEKPDPRSGAQSWLSHIVSTASRHFGSSLGGREQITIEFADGTPGRVFDPEDEVDVLTAMPGKGL